MKMIVGGGARNAGLSISGVGVVSPAGLGAPQTFTSVWAQLSRKRIAGEFYVCAADDPDFEEGEPAAVSPIDYFDGPSPRRRQPDEWLGFLAAQSFLGLLADAELPKGALEHLGLFVSLPPPRHGWGIESQQDFAVHFHNYARKDLLPHQQYSFSGQAGAILLLDAAVRALEEERIEFAAVGGVESYLLEPWLRDLDQQRRLKSSRNLDGFIPGEAAAFLLLEPTAQCERRGGRPLARLRAIATDKCPPAVLQNNTGLPLAKLLSELLAGCAAPPVVLCDLNGEPTRMREWGYVLSRIGKPLGSPCLLEHPADILGDVGAAAGSLLIGLSPYYLQWKHPGKESMLVWTASDNGDRAAVLLEALRLSPTAPGYERS